MGLFGNGDKGATHSKDAKATRQQTARAQDLRAVGSHPVRVADVKQRHSTNTGRAGRVIKSTLG